MKNNLFHKILRTPRGLISILVLGTFYLGAFFAPFLAPYQNFDQNLKMTYHPPTALLWKNGGLHAQIYKSVDTMEALYKKEDGKTTPVHFFVQGYEYKLFGFIPSKTHLFSVDAPQRIYLLGSDSNGRDVFSRLLWGSRPSMTIGLVGVALTMFLGLSIGGLAGYFGGWADFLTMRITELLMAIPGIYLLLTMRAAFAQHFTSDQMFYLVVIILGCIHWSGTARVVRGMSLSLRQRPFVYAAEVMGQTPWIIVWKHLLPNTFSYLIVAATLSIPGYILGEAGLSFLGLGIQEPSASWGLMLSQSQEMKIFMLNFWWLLTPGVAIFLTVVSFNILGDVLRDLVDPKHNFIK